MSSYDFTPSGSGGGSRYDFTPSSGGSAPKKKGGFGHFVSQSATDLENAAVQTPGALMQLHRSIAKADPSNLSHFGHGNPDELKAVGKAYVQQMKDIAHHPGRHPGDTFLAVLPGASAVARGAVAASRAARLAKAGETAAAVKALVKKPDMGPRVLKVGGMESHGHYSRSTGAAVVQKAVDKTLQKAEGTGSRVENRLHKRAAKWNERNLRVGDAKARSAGTRLAALGKNLTDPELRALRLVAEQTPVARRLGAQEMRKGRATHPKEQARHQTRIDLTKQAQAFLDEHPSTGAPVFKPGATKLRNVYSALEKASGDRGEMLKNLGLMDEAAQQAAKTKVARVAAGAGYVKPTAARLGKPSDPLVRQRAYVAELEKRHGAALTKAAEKAVPYGNVHTRTGYRKQDLKTAPELALKRQHVEVAPGKKTPGVPSAMPAKGLTTATTERLGAALSVARDRLARMEAGAASRVKPTGIVGAEDITASPDAVFIGNPVERNRVSGKQKVSSGGTFGHTRKPGSLKTSTGGSVAHALERNDVTQIVAERHAEAVRLSGIHRRVDLVKKAGTTSPRRKDDVWVWTDKTVSNKRIPAEVKKYLDNPEGITRLHEGEQQSIMDHLKDAVLQRHDWEGSPDVLAEFEKLAQEGKGVFVPRRLLGDAGKKSVNVDAIPGIHFLDAVNNAQKAGLIYLKLNYPVVQALSNTAMNMIHQGFAAPVRITQAVRLEHSVGAEYAAMTDDIIGGGAVLQAAFHGQGAISHVSQQLARIMSSKVDTPARRAAFIHEAHKAGFNTPAKYKALFDDDVNAQKLAEVAQRAKEAIVDYSELSPTERAFVRRLIFVYPWQKGATKYAGHFVRDHPVQAAALGMLGEQGDKQNLSAFGPLPTYLKGAFEAGGGLVNPSGVNFLQTPAQIGRAVIGTATGDPASRGAGLGFLAPAPGIVAGLLSGHDDIGRPLKSNVLGNIRDLTYGQTPVAAMGRAGLSDRSDLIRKALGSRNNSKSFPDKNDAFWRFLLGGLYPRQYDKGALNQNAAYQKTGR